MSLRKFYKIKKNFKNLFQNFNKFLKMRIMLSKKRAPNRPKHGIISLLRTFFVQNMVWSGRNVVWTDTKSGLDRYKIWSGPIRNVVWSGRNVVWTDTKSGPDRYEIWSGLVEMWSGPIQNVVWSGRNVVWTSVDAVNTHRISRKMSKENSRKSGRRIVGLRKRKSWNDDWPVVRKHAELCLVFHGKQSWLVCPSVINGISPVAGESLHSAIKNRSGWGNASTRRTSDRYFIRFFFIFHRIQSWTSVR